MLPGRNELPPAQNPELFGRIPFPTWTIRVYPCSTSHAAEWTYDVTTKTSAARLFQERRSRLNVSKVTPGMYLPVHKRCAGTKVHEEPRSNTRRVHSRV